MFGSTKNGANAYAKVGVETGVMAANPHKLIVMLFEGAEVALRLARQQMADGDVPAKGHSISKAINIIDNGLRASLDKKAGGEIATNLEALYEYMVERLLHANLNNSSEMLQEVLQLLAELRGAWEAIAPGMPAAPAAASRANGHDVPTANVAAFARA
jgi:flagellar protein FliS